MMELQQKRRVEDQSGSDNSDYEKYIINKKCKFIGG